ncbi:MAG TPA: cytochrome c-550 PedF [Rhodospirillaceae bacterium]|nr:cytochrome c-550 PedF [Rhodospirillaceae bacterium]
MSPVHKIVAAAFLLTGLLAAPQALMAHGDVQPQPVDTTGLKPIGKAVLKENPYRGDALAIKIGEHGYTQNCARCHGIGAISGGISPDLRKMDPAKEGDEWYIYRSLSGSAKDGRVLMPKFEGIISQEGLWAIRSWLDTLPPPND